MGWTLEMVQANNAKHGQPKKAEPRGVVDTSDHVELETPLHNDIIIECNRCGWVYFHSRTDKRTTRPEGEPDFIIMMNGGLTLYVECKRKGEDLSNAQEALTKKASALGHKIHLVRSMREFQNAVKVTIGNKFAV